MNEFLYDYQNLYSFIQKPLIKNKISLYALIYMTKKYKQIQKHSHLYKPISKTIIKYINQNLFYNIQKNYYFENISNININDWILFKKSFSSKDYHYGIVINKIINDNIFDNPITLIIQSLETANIFSINEHDYDILASISFQSICNIINYKIELNNKIKMIRMKNDMLNITNLIITYKTNQVINWQ